MKIIDERGRLFGKINIIDFLTLLFLFSLVPMFYFGYRIAKIKSPEEAIGKQWIEMEFPCLLRGVDPEALNLIKAGDRQLDADGKQIGEVVEVGEARPHQYKIIFFPSGGRDYLIKEDKVLKEVPVKLRLTMEIKDDNRIFYNGQPVAYDLPFDFDTGKYLVKTVAILQPPEDSLPRRWVKVKVRFSGLSPELADIVNNGHIEKDNKGRIIGRIDEILERQPSAVQALKLEENNFTVINDPFRRDLTAVLSLFCLEDESGLYFKNYPVKIGSQINFSSKLYLINGTVINLDLSGPKDGIQ